MTFLNRVAVAATLLTIAWVGSAHAQVNTVYGQQAAASEQYNANISVFGYQALYACQSCYGTTAMGYQALRVASGSYNTAVGFNSMINSTSGYANVGVGAFTLQNLGTGSQNVAIGYNAGSCATVNGSSNIWINNCGLAKDDRTTRIGTEGVTKFTTIAGLYTSKVVGGRALVVDNKGHVGYAVTKVVPNTEPVTMADLSTLRDNLVAVSNRLYKVERENAALKAKLGIR